MTTKMIFENNLNITITMKASKLIVLMGLATALFASCSSDNDVIEAGGVKPDVLGSAVVSNSNVADLNSRVTNYKSSNTARKAADATLFKDVLGMPTEPTTVPASAKALKMGDYTGSNVWDLPAGEYYIPAGETYQYSSNYSNSTIYIAGTFNTGNGVYCNASTKIVVLKGGKLILGADTNPLHEATVVNFGTIDFSGITSKFQIQGPFYTIGDVDLGNNRFDVQSQCYIGGSLKASAMDNAGAVLNIVGDCTLSGTGEFRVNGPANEWDTWTKPTAMHIGGKFYTNGDMSMNSGAKFFNECSATINGNLNMNSGSNIEISYCKAKSFVQSSGANVVLSDQSMIDVEGEYACYNQDIAKTYIKGDNASAYVRAGQFNFNNGAQEADGTYSVDFFGAPGDNSHVVVDGKFYVNGNPVGVNFNGNNVHRADASEAAAVIVKKSDCNNNTGYNDKPTTPSVPTFDLISGIDYDHTHDISATCVAPYSEKDKMYMSYHTRGNSQGACLEVFQPVDANKQVKLLQYLRDNEDMLDYNHIMIDKTRDRIYMAGNHAKKGGMLAYMDIDPSTGLLKDVSSVAENAEGNTYVKQPLQIMPLDAKAGKSDVNCVVLDNEPSKAKHLLTASTNGYECYSNDDTYARIDQAKSGKAKHLCVSNSKIFALVLDRRTNDPDEAIDAYVEVFDRDADPQMQGTPMLRFKAGQVEPNNGKNVIAVRDNRIYVCLGASGVRCFDEATGTEKWTFQIKNPINKDGSYKAYANGCCVTDNNVFVAYGSYGLVALDLNGTELTHRECGYSANYVTEYNGYLYVAYGKSRLQVFKFNNAK